MKVVQFIDTLRSGGRERQLVELLKGLGTFKGIESELIVMSDNIHYIYLDDLKIPVHKLLRRSKKDPRIFFKLYKLLKKIQPEILHSWGSMCSIYALPAVKILGIKFVNGFLRNAPPKLSMGNENWLRSKLTFPFSDAIVANSKAGLKAYEAPPKKSYYIYNGFDFNRTRNLAGPEVIKKKYQITTEKVVGMVASFTDKKDYHTYIDAAQFVLTKRNDITFIAIGDGENLETIKKRVPDKFKDYIKFPGKLNDIESLVQLMTIGVLISSYTGEGISNSIMEYMALGKPVLATDCAGNRELVIDGATGYLVQSGDVTELSKLMLYLLDNPELANKFGEAGAKRLKNMFNLERMTEDYHALYRQLITIKKQI